MSETRQDMLIHLFSGPLCSSLSCLCPVTLSRCGTSLPLSSTLDQTREIVCQQENEKNMEAQDALDSPSKPFIVVILFDK